MWQKIWNNIGSGEPYLHDLGDVSKRNTACASTPSNLYTDDIGNPEVPENFENPAQSCRLG